MPVLEAKKERSMSMQAAQVALFAKLFWIWIGLLISVFVFWRLMCFLQSGKGTTLPPQDLRMKRSPC